ncbi:MAG TPA: hypothetical protein VKB42_05190 [Dongiaceae bacterium]|nr:hypothetical protein [Dongiaceae bacterium]
MMLDLQPLLILLELVYRLGRKPDAVCEGREVLRQIGKGTIGLTITTL